MKNIVPNEDGITHINIYSKGKTELGKLLSNFAHTPFELPNAGNFESVEGYWYWLLTGSEELRYLYGFSAKQVGKRILTQQHYYEHTNYEGFRRNIKNAFCAKLTHNPKIKEMLIESSLPFTHYYVFNGKKKEAGYEWQVEFWENMRKELQNLRLVAW